MLWAIRRGCHVDPVAEFRFFRDASEAPGGAELFDVAGARVSHRGDACSLREISEIVHDAVIRGMQPALEALTLHTDAIFDGLYTYLQREAL